MNPSDESVYIVANYMSSKTDFFQNNTIDHFRVKLSKPFTVTDGSWKVALCEIEFENVTVSKEEQLQHPKYYEIELERCNGFSIHGHPTHVLRRTSYNTSKHEVFHRPYYLPIQTGTFDTFEITIRATTAARQLTIDSDSPNATITCTLHFKKDSHRN